MELKKLMREKHYREDGWLAEIFSMNHPDSPFDCFHSYIVNIAPNSVRAMHYHKQKKEWMALASGRIEIVLEDIDTKDRLEKILDENSEKYSIIFVPPMIAHVVKNIGNRNASLIVFSQTAEIPDDTIHYEMEV